MNDQDNTKTENIVTMQGAQFPQSSGSETARGNVGNTTNIPKLDGKKFQSWKEMIDIILRLRGLGGALTREVDELIDLQARLLLLETMDESHRIQVRGCAKAKDIMERLIQVYADRSASNLYRLLH